MGRQNRVGLIAGVWLVVMLLMTACQGEEKETVPETGNTQISTEEGVAETPGSGAGTEASTEVSVRWDEAELTEEELVLLTLEEASETEMQLMSELWNQILGKVYCDYELKEEYQISAYVEKFPIYSDSFIEVELFFDRSVHRSGTGFDRQTELNVWTELDVWTESGPMPPDYSEYDVQAAKENSAFAMDGTISKTWTDEIQAFIDSSYYQKSVIQVYEMMIGTAGQLYAEKNGGIEGLFDAEIYLTEHSIDKSTLKCTYWVCLEGEEPVCVTGTYSKTAEAGETAFRYEVLSTGGSSETAPAESALLTIDVQLNTEVRGNGKLLEYSVEAENAEQSGVALQKELALAVLESGVWDIRTAFSSKACIVTQEVYLPWLREEADRISDLWMRQEVITQPVLVEGENPLLGSSGGGSQRIVWENRSGEAVLTEDGYRLEVGEATEDSTLPDVYGARVSLQSAVECIGDVPLGTDSPGDGDRLRAAELLLGAALRYLAENATWTTENNLKLEFTLYLINSDYDLDAPEGEFLIQMDGKKSPMHLKIAYDGSCRDAVPGYTVWKSGETQSFYEVTDALCLKNTVSINLYDRWLYSTYLLFEQYGELSAYAGEYGVFVGEARDYDGDGTEDRVFLHAETEGSNEAVLFLGDGAVFRLDYILDGVEWYLDMVDLTGDGLQEVVFQSMKGMSPLKVYERTEEGLQELAFRYAVEGDNGTVGQARFYLPIEKMEGTANFRYIRPDGSGEVVFTLTEEEAESVRKGTVGDATMSYVFYYVAGDACELIGDGKTDAYRLHMTGHLIPQLRVEWDLVYEDGVWVEKNITQTREE